MNNINASGKYGPLTVQFKNVSAGFAAFIVVTSIIVNVALALLALWVFVAQFVTIGQSTWDGWNVLWLTLSGLFLINLVSGD